VSPIIRATTIPAPKERTTTRAILNLGSLIGMKNCLTQAINSRKDLKNDLVVEAGQLIGR
jgi:hypothetical protein